MSAPSPDIDPLVKQFQSLQEQTQALVMGRQNFLSRLNENKMVQEVRCVAPPPPAARTSAGCFHSHHTPPLSCPSRRILTRAHIYTTASCRSLSG